MSLHAESEPYRMPESYSAMTIHHLYGFTGEHESGSIDLYFLEHQFALLADLAMHGFTNEEVEDAVNSSNVHVAHWPEVQPQTDFFWVEGEGLTRLTDLADRAVELCFGQDEHAPVGGNFVTVGSEIGSQQLALAGLIYARESGVLREIAELGDAGSGPLYVVRDSFSGRMFDVIFPEGSTPDSSEV